MKQTTQNPCVLYHDKIAQAHHEGDTTETIAKKAGLTIREIRSYLWASNTWGAKQVKYCKSLQDQINKLYDQGETIENIALKTCFSVKAVRRYLWVTNKWGNEDIEQSDTRHQCSSYHKQIVKLHQDGHSYSYIGKRFGFNPKSIKYYLQKIGLVPKLNGKQLRKSVGSNFGDAKGVPIICEWPPR